MKPITLAFALLGLGFYGSADAKGFDVADIAFESRQLELGSRAVAACANIEGCILDSSRANTRAVQVFNHLTGQGSVFSRSGYNLAMAAVQAGVDAGMPVACKAMLAHGQAILVTTGVQMDAKTRASLEECRK